MAAQHDKAHISDETLELSREVAVEHYVKKRARKERNRILKAIAVTLLALLVAAGAAAGIYVAQINMRLGARVNRNLRDTLATTEAGEPFYMLLLGVDKNEDRTNDPEYGPDDSAYRSDSIMLVRVDPKKPQVTLVSIHRDTLVNLDEYGQQKINTSYALGGPAYAVETVSKFAGVPISHYAELDFDSFCMLVDRLGGIEVDVPVDVYDPNWTGADIKAGVQIVDGNQALQLSRARHAYDAYGDGDLYRAANQRMVIAAIVKKILAQDPVTMAATISSAAESVTTDMDVTEILSLATSMASLDVENDIYSGMNPTTSELINEVYYEICDLEEWQHMMSRVDQGLPPYEDPEDDPTTGIAGNVGWEKDPSAEMGSPFNYESNFSGTVRVFNGSHTEGAATQLSYVLSDVGYEVYTADANSREYEDTLIIYNDYSNAGKARGVMETLGVTEHWIPNIFEQYDTDVDVVIILGNDLAPQYAPQTDISSEAE